MRTQPVDRQRAKHKMKTAPRQIPALIERRNKKILGEMAPWEKWGRYHLWGYWG